MILVFMMNKKLLNYSRVCMMINVIMTAFKSLTAEYSGKVCENVCLQKRNQYFNKINEHNKSNGQRGKPPSDDRTHCSEDKDQRDQTNNNDVAGKHVCKKTYHQRKWLCKYSQYLHNNKNRLNCTGNRRIENMCPIMFIAASQDDNERHKG